MLERPLTQKVSSFRNSTPKTTSDLQPQPAVPSMFVPVIDINAFLDETSSQEARDAVAEQVGRACRDIGFLVITNHGVADTTIKGAFQAAREYFDQSAEEKHKVPMSAEYPYGYECGEILSKSREDGVTDLADLKETFQICIGALGKTPVLTPLWPEGPESFKPAMTTYYRSLEKLASTMMQIFACALKLPPTWFDNKIDNHMSSLRILYVHCAICFAKILSLSLSLSQPTNSIWLQKLPSPRPSAWN